jgi:hypothetical protein
MRARRHEHGVEPADGLLAFGAVERVGGTPGVIAGVVGDGGHERVQIRRGFGLHVRQHGLEVPPEPRAALARESRLHHAPRLRRIDPHRASLLRAYRMPRRAPAIR